MNFSQNCIDLVKRNEGCFLSPYLCPAGVPTIGYGHTHGVRIGISPITQEQADEYLNNDLSLAALTVINTVGVPLSQGQFDSLTDFVFNCGAGNFGASTLLKKLNALDYAGAAKEFGKWIHAKGVVLPGLVKRRAEERSLFIRSSKGTSDELA